MSDKKHSPREAALAVLKKAQELYQASSLSKAESKHDRCVEHIKENSPDVKNPHAVCVAEGVKPAKWEKSEKSLEKKYEGFKAVEESAKESGASDPAAVAAAVGRKKYGKKAFQEAAAAGKKMKKSDESGKNPDAEADAKLGEEVEQKVHEHEEKNEDPGHDIPMKGHLKLAKFLGKIEQKRSTNG